MSKINGIEELSKSTFPFNFKINNQYQLTEPGLMDKFKTSKYKYGYFCGLINKILIL